MNLKNWKTSSTGLIQIITGVVFLFQGNTEFGAAAIIGGFGLLFAKDSTTTGIGPNATTLHELEEKK